MNRHFFTFGSGTPYAQCYVEVELEHFNPNLAREVMLSAHGTKWAFQYDDEGKFLKQIEEYGLKRLSLIGIGKEGYFYATEIMGEN